MDSFSVGCVIAEIFMNGRPLFSRNEILKLGKELKLDEHLKEKLKDSSISYKLKEWLLNLLSGIYELPEAINKFVLLIPPSYSEVLFVLESCIH